MSRIEGEDILRAVEALGKVHPTPAATDRAVQRVREALKANQRARNSRRIRGIIMKIAIPSGVAAAILIVVGFLLSIQTTQPVSAAEQLKEIIKINDAYKGWIHITLESITPGATTQLLPKSGAMHLNTNDNTFAQVVEFNDQRLVTYVSPAKNEAIYYRSKTNELEIGTLSPGSARGIGQHVSKFATVDGILGMLNDDGEKKYEIKQSRAGRYERFHISPIKPETGRSKVLGLKKMVVYVDPDTKLIRRITGESPEGITFVYGYSYGEPAIKDIYSLGVPRNAKVIDNRGATSQPARQPKDTSIKAVPRSAKVVDNRPVEQARTIMDRLEKRIEKGLGDYVAVLTVSNVQSDGTLSNQRGILRLFGSNQGRFVSNQYRVGRPANTEDRTFFSLMGMPEGWPKPDVKKVLKRTRNAMPVMFFVMDGRRAWSGFYNTKTHSYVGGDKELPHLDMIPWKAENVLVGQIWPSPWRWYGLGTKVELLNDKNHPNQTGLRVRTYSYPTPKTKQLSETTIWLDPARDDMPVEKISRTYEKDNKTVKREYITRYLSYAQLPNGQWYPTRWKTTSGLYRGMGQDRVQNRGRLRSTREYNLQIFPNMKLEGEWFTNPAEKFKMKKDSRENSY